MQSAKLPTPSAKDSKTTPATQPAKAAIYNAVFYIKSKPAIKAAVNNSITSTEATIGTIGAIAGGAGAVAAAAAGAALAAPTKVARTQHPYQLTVEQIKKYCEILQTITPSSTHIVKVGRKSAELVKHGLPFSALQYPGDKGFYLLDTVLGEGYWGRVKTVYYVDEHGKLNPNPIVDKIVEKQLDEKLIAELSIFSTVHPTNQKHLNKFGKRLNSGKKDTFIEKFPGRTLNSFLKNNPQLNMIERLHIAAAFINALANIHKHKIAHLDVHSGNVLYDPATKTLSMIDFGCAERVGTKIIFVFPGTPEAKLGVVTAQPEYGQIVGTNNTIAVDTSLDVYSAALLIGQIMGLTHEKMLGLKLKHALQQPKDQLPADLEKLSSADPKAIEFLKKYMSFAECDFDGLDLELRDIALVLKRMTDSDPKKRPSAQEVALVFQRVIEQMTKKQNLSQAPTPH